MPEITAALVKDLREKTGAGMMDCKRALTEAGGDMEAAVDWLRTKGLAAAAKKSGRVAAEGLVGVVSAPGRAAMVEVNAETDFVARNETFQAFVEAVAKIALQVGEDLDAIKAAPFPGSGRTVAEELTQLVATIGENMNIRRARVLSVGSGVVATYVHNALKPGLGKIGVLVAIEGTGEMAALETLGRQVGMHIAASTPEAIDIDGVDPAALAAREVGAGRAGARLGPAGQHHREDGRGPHPQVLRGGRAARAGLGARRREPGEGGARQGRREAGRVRPLQAGRRDRQAARVRISRPRWRRRRECKVRGRGSEPREIWWRLEWRWMFVLLHLHSPPKSPASISPDRLILPPSIRSGRRSIATRW